MQATFSKRPDAGARSSLGRDVVRFRATTLATTLAVLAVVGSSVTTALAVVDRDLQNLTAAQIIQDYKDRRYTPTELTQAYLDRIAKYNPVYNAYTTLNPAVLADAAVLTAKLSDPNFVIPSPMWGVPTGIKDPMNVAGLRTTAGSSYFGTYSIGTGGTVAPGAVEMIPAEDCPQVARLRAAGTLILGKTSICDFARVGAHSNSSLNGITHNAYDIHRTPGGSSGGSGVAVAAGLAAMATAEETGSSITNPSSASSVVGIKPTFGTIPSSGVFPLAGYFRDTDGVFGKTVHDAAAMFDVEAGPSPLDTKPAPALNNIPAGGFVKYINDHPNALAGKKIGVFNLNGTGFSTQKVTNAETISLFQRETNIMKNIGGATLVDDPFNTVNWLGAPTSTTGTFSNTQSYDVKEFLKTLGPDAAFKTVAEYDAKYSAASGKTFYNIPNMPAATIINGVIVDDDPATRPEYDSYRTRVAQIRALFTSIMDAAGIDALVLPQLAEPVGTNNIVRTPGGTPNLMGTPGIVVPGGYYSDGTPFATYFIGRLNDDAGILALAADYERITQNRVAPVLVPEPSMAVFGLAAIPFMTRRRRTMATAN